MAYDGVSDESGGDMSQAVRHYREGGAKPPHNQKIPFDVKRLQCWYWTHTGNCIHNDDNCRYAHEMTGKVAGKPIKLKNGHSVAGRNATTDNPVYQKWQPSFQSRDFVVQNDERVGTNANGNRPANGAFHDFGGRAPFQSESHHREERPRGRSRSPVRKDYDRTNPRRRPRSTSNLWSSPVKSYSIPVDKQTSPTKAAKVKIEPVKEINKHPKISTHEIIPVNKQASVSHQVSNPTTLARNSNHTTSKKNMESTPTSKVGPTMEDPLVGPHLTPDSADLARPVEQFYQQVSPTPTPAQAGNRHASVFSHPEGRSTPENTHMSISVGQWSSLQDKLSENEQQIDSQSRELLVANQTIERYRFIIDQASRALNVGVDALSNHGFLAMDMCQKIQRGEAITKDEVTDTWLNANELLRQADAFLNLNAQWARLCGSNKASSRQSLENAFGSPTDSETNATHNHTNGNNTDHIRRSSGSRDRPLGNGG